MILRTSRQPSTARLELFRGHFLILIVVHVSFWVRRHIRIHRPRKFDGLAPTFMIPQRPKRFQVFSRVKSDSMGNK